MHLYLTLAVLAGVVLGSVANWWLTRPYGGPPFGFA
jgi:membrane protein YqaA with SNARE-associated domain